MSSAYLYWTDGEGAVQRAEIGTTPLTIGGQGLCGVVLDDRSVAAVHAVIEPRHDGQFVRRLSRCRELGMDGVPIEETRLHHGARLELGGALAIYLEARLVAPRMLRATFALDGEDAAAELELPGALTIIGRRSGHVLVEDPSVSRVHLEMENYGAGLRWVRDLGSTNGSELNGERLTGRRPFGPGDVLRAGRVEIRIDEGEEPPDGVRSVIRRTVLFDQDRALAAAEDSEIPPTRRIEQSEGDGLA